jgi:aminobenzoyl-glutamate transport protein
MTAANDTPARKPFGLRLLDAIETAGNKLPDPATLFFVLIGVLMVVSAVAAAVGLSAVNPATGEAIQAKSLLSNENLARLFTEMSKTFTSFAPLGTVLVTMLGAGIAEKTGLFSASLRSFMKNVPGSILVPATVFAGCMSSMAADAGYVVLVPLGAVVFLAAGRHPLAGIAAAFAGVSGGFSANLLITSLDPLLLGITQEAARLIDPSYAVAIQGNWYVMIALTFLLTGLGWWVTSTIVEPRLGQWKGHLDAPPADQPLSADEKKGLAWAGWAFLAPVIMLCAFAFPGMPLHGEGEEVFERLKPFFDSLVPMFFLAFLAAGIAFGVAVGKIRNDKDVIGYMNQSMADMGAYLVLAFAAAHFIAMFAWSNLGAIAAVHGAEGLRSMNLPGPALFIGLILFTASLNLLIASASAKWGLMAPIVVPMMMLLGYSPEAVTAAYRLGDSATNIITPMMAYFPMVLIFARRYQPDAGLGTLIALMLPYSITFLLGSFVFMGVWVGFGWDVGPGVPVQIPAPVAAG